MISLRILTWILSLRFIFFELISAVRNKINRMCKIGFRNLQTNKATIEPNDLNAQQQLEDHDKHKIPIDLTSQFLKCEDKLTPLAPLCKKLTDKNHIIKNKLILLIRKKHMKHITNIKIKIFAAI